MIDTTTIQERIDGEGEDVRTRWYTNMGSGHRIDENNKESDRRRECMEQEAGIEPRTYGM